ncbi:hypothetical protein FVEN_g12963 [Fusarium venenatum]|uniref:uncharacterized protein n=1 Tax=Fusarium venenatum TaxID=56646 RepID=UPI001D6C548C|nr:hypothetical protein FVEN_g12963 [Fusarium venenatum]KAH7002869.1 hypothetical protein EDB82DRAFT_1634 [Fusarium venenatum]
MDRESTFPLRVAATRRSYSTSIGNWNLTLEYWIPSPDETKSASIKKVIKQGTQKALSPWSGISGISGAQNLP